MAKEQGWKPNEMQQRLLDMARRIRPNLRVTTGGPAAGAPTAKPPVATPAPSTTDLLDSSDTSATATAVESIETPSPASTTSASVTWGSSNVSTDWTLSPIGYVESGLVASIETLAGLPEATQQSLQALATGSGQPLWAVIQQISEFLIAEESEWAEAPLSDALTFYTTQYLL